jgi:hypothetical protein
VLVLFGGTAAGLNTWHALEAGELPPLWAVVVGIGPVLLAVVLSHLVALVLDDAPEQRRLGDQRAPVAATGRAAANPPVPGTFDRSAPAPCGRERTPLPGRSAPTAALSGPGSTSASRWCRHGATIGPRTDQQQVVGCRPRDVTGTIHGWNGWPPSCAPGSS